MQFRISKIGEVTVNTDDRMVAVSLATEPQNRKSEEGDNVGGLWVTKANGKNPYGFDIAEYMLANNGTIKWDIHDPINGRGTFDNIYQYIAAEVHAPQGTIRERLFASEEYERDMRSGMNTFAKWMDEQWTMALYRLTSPSSGNKTVIITIHPEYVDPLTGKTAADLQRVRDRKAIQGQTEASFKRLARFFGEGAARVEMQTAVSETLSKPLPGSKRNRIDND